MIFIIIIINMSKYLGAHISKEITILKTLIKIKESEGNALQLFVSNPRSVAMPNLIKINKEADDIKKFCKDNEIKMVIHASYTINLAKPFNNGKKAIEIKDCLWIKSLIAELEVANLINACGVVVHVGKYTTQTKEEGLENMHKAIKYILNEIKELKLNSKLILETPAGQGTELLVDLKDFIDFYNSFSNPEKEHLKICIDTAHVWSSGYNLIEAYNLITKTNKNDILVIHLNNSKKLKGSKVDTHDEIFKGKIDSDYLINVYNKTNNNIIIILEKPSDNLKKEINDIKNH